MGSCVRATTYPRCVPNPQYALSQPVSPWWRAAPPSGLDNRRLTRYRPDVSRTATAKFQRSPATGAEAKRREQFGKEWGAYNSAAAKRLRAKR